MAPRLGVCWGQGAHGQPWIPWRQRLQQVFTFASAGKGKGLETEKQPQWYRFLLADIQGTMLAIITAQLQTPRQAAACSALWVGRGQSQTQVATGSDPGSATMP